MSFLYVSSSQPSLGMFFGVACSLFGSRDQQDDLLSILRRDVCNPAPRVSGRTLNPTRPGSFVKPQKLMASIHNLCDLPMPVFPKC